MFSRREFGGWSQALPLSVLGEVAGAVRGTRRPTPCSSASRPSASTTCLRPATRELLPTIVSNMVEIGVAECEIMSGHVEPYASYTTGWWVQSRRAPGFQKVREEARQWRLTVPLDYYREVRRQFDDSRAQNPSVQHQLQRDLHRPGAGPHVRGGAWRWAWPASARRRS